jgi:RHS repeat-associated protein
VRKPTDGTRTDYLVNGYQVASILHAKQVQGSWAYLGNFALGAGGTPLQLSEYSNSPTYGSLAGIYLMADAVRFKLVEADTGLEGNYSYAIVDQVGAPQAVMDRAGRLVWRATYDPFGAASVDADPDHDGALFTLNLRLPGQYFDGESTLHYNHFRDYDPSLGRYIESDPLGVHGGMNTFAYVQGNPLMVSDPTGLTMWRGTGNASTGGELLGGGVFVFDLTSDCAAGTQYHIGVRAWAAGLTIGKGYSGMTNFDIVLDDQYSPTASDVAILGQTEFDREMWGQFKGPFFTAGIGGAAGGGGIGPTAYQFGSSKPVVSDSVTTTGGLDASASMMWGKSTVFGKVTTTRCGCK